MHLFSAILSGIFIALVIGFALTFGVVMFVVLGLIGLGAAALFYAQIWWRRWQIKKAGGNPDEFIHHRHHQQQQRNTPPPDAQIIDAEYHDVTDKK